MQLEVAMADTRKHPYLRRFVYIDLTPEQVEQLKPRRLRKQRGVPAGREELLSCCFLKASNEPRRNDDA